MEPVRLGVIGCGVIGSRHAQIAEQSRLVELRAVADLIEDRAKSAAERHGVPNVYRDGAELVQDPDVEAVVIAFPACGRTDMALKAFAAGKHVLTEKPVAMNADEVRRLIAARGGLTAGCCSPRFRFPKAAQVATDFIASGALGDLRVLHVRALVGAGLPPDSPRPEWRLKKHLNAGGIMSNWGCYDLDYMLGLTGWSLKPERVFAQVWPIPPQLESHVPPDSTAETHVAALVRFTSGAVLHYERGEYMAASNEGSWHIIGAKGSLRLQMSPGGAQKVVFEQATEAQGLVSETLYEGEEDRRVLSTALTDHFATAVREGRQPTTGLEESLIVQRITDAIYASAEQGAAVAP